VFTLRTFKRIEQSGGKLTVVCEQVAELTKDELGRMKIVPAKDSEHTFTADSVIFAVGQKPDIGGFDLADARGLLTVSNSAASSEGVFACGDAVSGTSSVIQAIASARSAAEAIDRYLGGNGDITEILTAPEEPSAYLGRAEKFASRRRIDCPTADNASCEADRCLRCHLRLKIEKPKFWNEYGESQVSK
jgi:NADPH-dependent 2,4-dienoyl-CoA reductase/sulfur reductase-like enzyme